MPRSQLKAFRYQIVTRVTFYAEDQAAADVMAKNWARTHNTEKVTRLRRKS